METSWVKAIGKIDNLAVCSEMLAVLLLEVQRKNVDELNNLEQKMKQNLGNFIICFVIVSYSS